MGSGFSSAGLSTFLDEVGLSPVNIVTQLWHWIIGSYLFLILVIFFWLTEQRWKKLQARPGQITYR